MTARSVGTSVAKAAASSPSRPCWRGWPASGAPWSSRTASAPAGWVTPTRPSTCSRTSSTRSPPVEPWRRWPCPSSPASSAPGAREDADRTASALLTWAVAVLVPLSVAARPVGAVAQRLPVPRRARSPGRPTSAPHAPASSPRRWRSTASASCWPGCSRPTGRFLAAALAPLLSSLVVIAAYVGYRLVAEPGTTPADISSRATWVLAGGTTLGVVVLSLPLLVPVAAGRGPARPTFSFPEGVARRAAVAGRCRASSPWWPSRPPSRPPCGSPTPPAPSTPVSSTSTPTSRPSTCSRMPCWPSRSRRPPSPRWPTRPPSRSSSEQVGHLRPRHAGRGAARHPAAHGRCGHRPDGGLAAGRRLLRLARPGRRHAVGEPPWPPCPARCPPTPRASWASRWPPC